MDLSIESIELFNQLEIEKMNHLNDLNNLNQLPRLIRYLNHSLIRLTLLYCSMVFS